MTDPTDMRLARTLQPCGPVIDEAAAGRVRETLDAAADAGGWSAVLEQAWPALAPVVAASPYLASLAQRDPARLRRVLESAPDARLATVLQSTATLADEPDSEAVKRELRRLKAELHLLAALADLGGVWDLGHVTGALSRFADAAVQAALAAAARMEQARGSLLPSPDASRGPVPGLFCLALGKHGGFELNYSSDIDITIFYAPELMPIAAGADRDNDRRAARPHPVEPDAGADRRRLRLPHRPAAAARPVLHLPGDAGGGRPRPTTNRPARIGSGRR